MTLKKNSKELCDLDSSYCDSYCGNFRLALPLVARNLNNIISGTVLCIQNDPDTRRDSANSLLTV